MRNDKEDLDNRIREQGMEELFCKSHLLVQPSHAEMQLLNLQFSVASGVWPSEQSDEAPCVAS